MMLIKFLCVCIFVLIFFIKAHVGNLNCSQMQVRAIQLVPTTKSSNLKTMELLNCALIGVYAVIRLNTVFPNFLKSQFDYLMMCLKKVVIEWQIVYTFVRTSVLQCLIWIYT